MWFLVGGGAVAALAAVAVALTVLISSLGRLPGLTRPVNTAGPAATTEVNSAISHLAGLPAAHYRGTLADRGQQLGLDVKVTSKGSTAGTVTVSGQKIKIFTAGGSTYVKAGPGYWRTNGATARLSKEYAKRWVKMSTGPAGFALSKLLAPPSLARLLGLSGQVDLSSGPVTKVNGVQARKVTAPIGAIYVTTTAPYQIVRIDSGASGGGPAPPTPHITGTGLSGGALVVRPARWRDDFRLNITVSALTGAQARTFIDQLKQEAKALRGAIDSSVAFSAASSGRLSPCNNSGCTATITISNRVKLDSPYLKVGAITADVIIDFQLDGRPVGSCRRQVSIPANGEAVVTCSVSYHAATNRSHSVRAQSTGFARALVKAEIPATIKALEAEQQAIPSAGSDTDNIVTDARVLRTPRVGTTGGGPGRWIKINYTKRRHWMRYQEQVTGVRISREYKVNGVKFDGYDGPRGVLLDAKLGYSKKLDEHGNLTKKQADKFKVQANRQIEAAKGTGKSIEWRFSNERVANAVREFFEEEGINIKVDHQRMNWKIR
ncbi:Tox-REase-5 domain-containing protein [Nonomuraea sp. NPDC001831]|uniref:Tox-REase-5 domain-containing protein n=1 Tax=Nonomuraea sp. NPDC001831 TaxID=3364340 RepID=UPI0036C695CC